MQAPGKEGTGQTKSATQVEKFTRTWREEREILGKGQKGGEEKACDMKT